MMEKFLEDAADWGDRHEETWIGRKVGPDWFGAGLSAQTDLMSPTGMITFARDPTLFHATKAMYNPMIAYGGYSMVGFLTGTKIGFAERVMHSMDMTRRLGHSVISTWGSHTTKALHALPRLIPYAFGAGLAFGLRAWRVERGALAPWERGLD